MYRVCIRFCQYLLIIKKQMQEKRYQSLDIPKFLLTNFGAFFAQKKKININR